MLRGAWLPTYKKAISAGYGDEEIAAVFEVLRKSAD